MTHDKHVTYISYLKVDELLELQEPLSEGPEHDELLFITIHQVYELWFKQLLHEAAALQVALEAGDSHLTCASWSHANHHENLRLSAGHPGDHDASAVQLL